MSDLIERQAATDALRKMQTYKLFSGDDMLLIDQAGAMTELMMLPSAQPEIVRCGECKYAHLTYNKEVKYCDFWETEDPIYMSADNFCSNAERREVTT